MVGRKVGWKEYDLDPKKISIAQGLLDIDRMD
jgi:hypothetical protein